MRHLPWPVPEPRTNADTAWALVTRFASGRLLDAIASGGAIRFDDASGEYVGTVQFTDDGVVEYIDWHAVAALWEAGEWAYLSSSERAVLDVAVRLGTGPDLYMLDTANMDLVLGAVTDGLARSFSQ